MDDLLDLNFNPTSSSNTPIKPSPSPATFSYKATLSSVPPSRTQSPLAFDLLSSTGSRTGNGNQNGNGMRGTPSVGSISGSQSLNPTPLRSNTPSSSLNPAYRNGNPSITVSSTSKPPSSSSSSDAFANLLSFSTPSQPNSSTPSTGHHTPNLTFQNQTPGSNGGNLSLLERQQKLEREKKEKDKMERDKFDFSSWNQGLTSSASVSSSSSTTATIPGSMMPGKLPPPLIAPKPTQLRPTTTATTTPSNRPPSLSSSENYSKVSYKPNRSEPKLQHLQNSSMDLFDLLEGSSSPLSPSFPVPRSTSLSPGPSSASFTKTTFGDRPQSRLGTKDGKKQAEQERLDDGEDLLGMLSGSFRKPSPVNLEVEGNETKRGAQSRSRPLLSPEPHTPNTASLSISRSSSPPPHILGQIVEMGFSLTQAKKALARTEGGMDVERAVEILVGGGGDGGGVGDGDDGEREMSRRGNGNGNGMRQSEVLDPEAEAAERRRRRRQGPSRGSQHETPPPAKDDNLNSITDLTDQADKILSQASDFGISMFSKANALWTSGKERATKILEEKAAMAREEARRQAGYGGGKGTGGGGGGGGRADGKPRWMVEAEEREREEEEERRGDVEGSEKKGSKGKMQSFKDSDDDEDDLVAEDPVRNKSSGSQPSRSNGSDRQSTQEARKFSSRPPVPAADLLSEPSGYQSPSRRKPISSKQPVRSSNGFATTSRSGPSVSKPVLEIRTVEPVGDSRVTASSEHKQKGNDLFKLGRFDDAVASYSLALETLPSKHLLTIPLYNNRAASRLKNGDHNGAISDCTIVIDIIGLDYHPTKEEPLSSGQVSEIKLSDGLFKALSKRASAYEMGEKWEKARTDWERLIGLPAADLIFAGGNGEIQKKTASEGLARSKKMCDVIGGVAPSSNTSENASAARPRPSTKPNTRKPTTSTTDKPSDPEKSVGVAKLREAASAAESEDALRITLKDSVDAKLNAWSKGKEANLRGLLAGLDAVLWDGLGLKKVGMAELITEKQVKIAYMRTIGKLHPDKLNATNTTVEQRMLANSVFAQLNESWHTFLGSS